MLGSMCGHGRTEAGVFLLGLLVNCDDNWEKRIKIVEAMKFIHTKPCADLLFGEIFFLSRFTARLRSRPGRA